MLGAWQRYRDLHPDPHERAEWCERCEAPTRLTELDTRSALVCRHSPIQRVIYNARQAWLSPPR